MAMITPGAKIVVSYLSLDYLVPLSLNLVTDTDPLFRTPLDNGWVLSGFVILLSLGFGSCLIAMSTPRVVPKSPVPLKPIPVSAVASLAGLLVFAGAYTASTNATQWRYGGPAISQQSDLALIAIAQLILPVLVFWVILTDHRLILDRRLGSILVKVGLVLALVLSINGLGRALLALILGMVLLLPRQMLPVLFESPTVERAAFTRPQRLVLIGLAIVVFAPAFLQIGVVAKSGASADIERSVEAHTNVDYLINRHSVHMSSALASIEDGYDYENLHIVRDSYTYRLGVIFGNQNVDNKPEIASYARKALVQYANFARINPRGGSSPGVMATFVMSFPFWAAAIGFMLYCFFLTKLLDFLLCRQPRFSWLGALTFAYFPLRLVTDSPADFLLPGPVLLVLAVVFLAARRRISVGSPISVESVQERDTATAELTPG